MTTEDVLKIVEKRGLKIALRNGQPVLEKAAGSASVTDELLAVLKFHRQRIIDKLTPLTPKPDDSFPFGANIQ